MLRVADNLTEVYFWQHGGNKRFRALSQGELFLFKLHSPDNFVVGGAFFQYSTLMPISLAWKAFGIGNGVQSLKEMQQLTAQCRPEENNRSDYTVGCILSNEPFFFDQEQ